MLFEKINNVNKIREENKYVGIIEIDKNILDISIDIFHYDPGMM